MAKKVLMAGLFLAVQIFATVWLPELSNAKEAKIPEVAEYLGQTPPGETAIAFTTTSDSLLKRSDRKIVFSPDGKESLIGIKINNITSILYVKYDNGHWTEPKTADFLVANQQEKEPFFSPDGKKIFFVRYSNICVSKRVDQSWGTPEMLGAPVNGEAEQYHPTVTKDGTLYFCSNRGGNYNIYKSKCENGQYPTVEKLEGGINSHENGSDGAYDPYIAPDESYLIFTSVRSGGYGKGDQYISFNKGGHWTEPMNLGAEVNTAGTEYGSYVSPDGKYYFFSRSKVAGADYWQRNSLSQVCWVQASFIDDLKRTSGQAVKAEAKIPDGWEYLGQKAPGDSAIVFAPGFITIDSAFVQNSTFSVDGKEFFFGISNDKWDHFEILSTTYKDGKWTSPAKVDFFDEKLNLDVMEPFFAPDGKRLYFNAGGASNTDLWYCEKEGGVWGKPIKIAETVNSKDLEWYPTVSKKNRLVFTRNGDIYYSAYRNGSYDSAVNFGSPVNLANYQTADPYLSPNEDYLIFQSIDRPGGLGQADLFISFKKEDGSWSEPINLGPKINTDQFEFGPSVTPDGKYFMFSRRKQWLTDVPSKIYWIKADFIEQLR